MDIPPEYVTSRFIEQLGVKPGGVWAFTNARRVVMTAHRRSANIFVVDKCRVALQKSSSIRFDSIRFNKHTTETLTI